MNRCPITYDDCGEARYSDRGLRLLSPRLEKLEPLPYSAERQLQEAIVRAEHMSVQGVQPKLSAVLSVQGRSFRIVSQQGRFILKPPNPPYPELPENEDLTMRLAEAAGIEVPIHGLVWAVDGTLTYFIRRFDRIGRRGKIAVEDGAQLAGRTRDTKYDYSVERLVKLLDHCTFPAVQRRELFRRLVFNFLVGNEDMHLKNYALIRRDGLVELAPGYDFVNTTCVYRAMGRSPDEIEETALPIRGRMRGLSRSLFLKYLAQDRLALTEAVVEDVLQSIREALPSWRTRIGRSFLSTELRKLYSEIVDERLARLELA